MGHQLDPGSRPCPQPRRCLGRRPDHPPDHVGGERRRAGQPHQGVVRRQPRRPCHAISAYGQGGAVHLLQRRDRLVRLPLRHHPDPSAPRPVRRGAACRRRVPGHLRQGQFLHRADGPRTVHRKQGYRRSADHCHQRLALRHGGGQGRPGRHAVHQLRRHAGRPQPLQVRRIGILHQIRRGDARAVQGPSRRLRQHAGDRGTLQRDLRRP